MKKRDFVLLGILVVVAFLLRFYQLSSVPHGLYFDEVSSGYNAYLILTQGIDEHGRHLPLWFEAFGEYKMPLYVYLTAFAIKLFGTTNFAVRFFPALFGSLTIPVFYFFSRELVLKSNWKFKNILPFLTTMLLTFSPWHLQFSHAGFEATIAAFFYLAGWLGFLIFLRTQKSVWLVLGTLSFALTLYTYNSYRPVTPLTVGVLFVYCFIMMKQIRKQIITIFFIFLILIFPLLLFTFSADGLMRLSQTTAFSVTTHLSFLQKLFLFPAIYLHNYFSYFSFNFLFGFGDGIGRHQIAGFGVLPFWQLPFLFIGMIGLLRQKSSMFKAVVLFLLLIAPVSAAIAVPSPHSLRSLPMIFPLSLVIGIGVFTMWQWCQGRLRLLILLVGIIALYETALYFHTYYGSYALSSTRDWGGEMEQVVSVAHQLSSSYKHIVVNTDLTFAAPQYFGFYDHQLQPIFISGVFHKPSSWANQKYLYITPEEKYPISPKLLQTVHLPNINKDVFAEFWEVK